MNDGGPPKEGASFFFFSHHTMVITMQIAELRPNLKKVDVKVRVLDKNDPREVSSKLDGRHHRVAEVLVGDESGCILLTLWDEAIDKMETGKCYALSNAFTSLFKHTLRLNLGREGKLEEIADEITANARFNVSEKEFEAARKY